MDLDLNHADEKLHISQQDPMDTEDDPTGQEYSVFHVIGTKDFSDVPIATDDFQQVQARDHLCKAFAATVGRPGSVYTYEHMGFLFRLSKLDGSLQRDVALVLRQKIMFMKHYPRLSGHPGSRKMFDTMRRKCYQSYFESDVAATVKSCMSCAKKSGTLNYRQKLLGNFPANGMP